MEINFFGLNNTERNLKQPKDKTGTIKCTMMRNK